MEELNKEVDLVNDNDDEIEVNESEEEFINEPSQENANKVKDYFYKETGLTIKDLANLFGQSEEEISKEFSSYKAKKLYSKMDYIIDEPNLSQEEFKQRCLLAEKYGFKSVTVLPTFVSYAKQLLVGKGIAVRVLIAYPFGEELFKVKLYSVKKSIQIGANQILISPSIRTIKSGNYKIVAKEIKKVVRCAGKRQVTVMLDENLLSFNEMEGVIRAVLKDVKACSIMTSSVFSNKLNDVQILKSLKGLVDGKCYLEGGGKIETASQTVQLLSGGANSITSKYCPDIAKELNMKIISSV